MNDPPLVGGFERFGDLTSDGQGFVERDRPLTDPVLERRPLDVFEDEGGGVARLLQPMNGRNIRMIERCQDLRFALETGQPLGVVDERVGQDLQGDIAVELGIDGPIDLAHSSLANEGSNVVVPEAVADV